MDATKRPAIYSSVSHSEGLSGPTMSPALRLRSPDPGRHAPLGCRQWQEGARQSQPTWNRRDPGPGGDEDSGYGSRGPVFIHLICKLSHVPEAQVTKSNETSWMIRPHG